MSRVLWDNLRAHPAGLCVALLALIISLASCSKPEKAAAAKEEQKTFASPQDAGTALVEAARGGDKRAILEIFGPDGKEVLFSGDDVKDRDALKNFVVAYETMNRWGKINTGDYILYVGAENYPFPIPLQQNSSGQWYFN